MSDIVIGVESVVTEIVVTVETGGVTIHNDLTGRDAAECHPASAIQYDEDETVAEAIAGILDNVHNDLPGRDTAGAHPASAINYGDGSVEEVLLQLLTAKAITGEPTGFTNPGGIIRTYDKLNRTITLTGDVEAYYNGALIPELVSGWVSDPHAESPAQTLFLYYDGTDFVWSTSPWDFDNLMIAAVPVYGSDIFGMPETHGLMQWQAHKEFHDTVGTYRDGGGDLSGYVLNSTVAANRRPDISALTVRDEDLPTTLAALISKLYTQVYFSGADTVNFVKSAADIVPLSGAQPYYNLFSGGVWSQALVSNNNYMSVWLVTFPTTSDNDSKEYRFQWLQGQSQGTLASQQALSPQNLSLGEYATFAPEFVFIARVIILYTAANWVISQVDNLFGTRASTVASPAGNFLTGITTDDTLSGNGTPSNPLSVKTNIIKTITLAENTSSIDITTDNDGNALNFVEGDIIEMAIRVYFDGNPTEYLFFTVNNVTTTVYRYDASSPSSVLIFGVNKANHLATVRLTFAFGELSGHLFYRCYNDSELLPVAGFRTLNTIGLNASSISSIRIFGQTNKTIKAGTKILIKKL